MSNARNISKAESRFVNASGDTITGDLAHGNIKLRSTGVENHNYGTPAPSPFCLYLNNGTYGVNGTYQATASKLCQFPTGGEAILYGRIMRQGDLNYTYMHTQIDFEIHQWGSSTSVYDIGGREYFQQRSCRFAFNADRSIWFHQGDLWSQYTQVIIWKATDNIDFSDSGATAGYHDWAGAPWKECPVGGTVYVEAAWGA